MSKGRQYLLSVVSPLAIALAVVCAVQVASSPGHFVLFGENILFSVEPSPVAAFSAREGETVVVEFSLKNITAHPIRAIRANSSCDCTAVVSPFPMDFAPGSTRKIEVQMKVPTGAAGKLVREVNLVADRAGAVPTLVLEVSVSESP